MHYGLCENGELRKEVLLLVYCRLALRATTFFLGPVYMEVGSPGR